MHGGAGGIQSFNSRAISNEKGKAADLLAGRLNKESPQALRHDSLPINSRNEISLRWVKLNMPAEIGTLECLVMARAPRFGLGGPSRRSPSVALVIPALSLQSNIPLGTLPAHRARDLFPFTNSPSHRARDFFPFTNSPAHRARDLFPFTNSPAHRARDLFPFTNSPARRARDLFPFINSPAHRARDLFPFIDSSAHRAPSHVSQAKAFLPRHRDPLEQKFRFWRLRLLQIRLAFSRTCNSRGIKGPNSPAAQETRRKGQNLRTLGLTRRGIF